jgi:hypothetical protein
MELQLCQNCGKPAESCPDTCNCICPSCGEHCFDDVTLADHGMCLDCFHDLEHDYTEFSSL